MGNTVHYIRNNARWIVFFVCLSILVLVWVAVMGQDRGGKLTVSFLNIGQGSAIYIESPTGVQVVVDGGPGKTLSRELSAVVPWYDRHIDMFIVTNPDRDHYEGFFDALNKYRVDVFMESGLASTTPEFNLLKDKVNNKKIPVVVARRGQVIDIGGGAYIEILFPNRDVSTLASNNSSIISRLVYGDTSFIFQGDAPQAMEEYVLALGANNLNSDVIALGHHGSRTSSGPEYIQAVSPQYAVISAGKNNSYGHPHKEVVETFKGTDSMLLSTCATGRITFESDGTDLVLNNKKIVPVVVGCK